MVSLGPSDYELVTIKALKTLQNSGAICVPTKSEDGGFDKSITYKIVKDLMREFGFDIPIIAVYTPMKFQESDWLRQAKILMNAAREYSSVSFVTLGDAAVYSTVYYLLETLKKLDKNLYDNSEVVAGVTSFSYASSRVKEPLCLGDTGFEVIPLVGKKTPSAKVYMRPKIGMDSDEINVKGSMYTFENLNLKGERIQKGKIQTVQKYMTLFIDFVKTKRGDEDGV